MACRADRAPETSSKEDGAIPAASVNASIDSGMKLPQEAAADGNLESPSQPATQSVTAGESGERTPAVRISWQLALAVYKPWHITRGEPSHTRCSCLWLASVSLCVNFLLVAGGKLQEESSGGSNGSKKPAKEDKLPEKDGDLLLAGSSAGSSKSRHGGSVYDLLVAEIKV